MRNLTTCWAAAYVHLDMTPDQSHEGWVCVPKAQLAEDGVIVRVNECPPIAVTRMSGELYAFLDVCPHLGATLSAEGELHRGRVVCRAHGRRFRLLRDGQPLRGAERKLVQFPIQVMDDCIHVSTPTGSLT